MNLFARSLIRLAVATVVLAFVSILPAQTPAPAPAPTSAAAAPAAPATPGLTLTTTAFEDGGLIPARFTQSDPNPISPKLDWTQVPAGTVSFALIMHDPDVALNRTTEDVLHWLIFNIPGTATGLPENVAPARNAPMGRSRPRIAPASTATAAQARRRWAPTITIPSNCSPST